MSNETKRDVFLQLAKENRDLRMYDPETIEPKELIEQDYQDWIREYDAALPDNLPVIPKAQSDWIKQCKANDDSLSFALGDETTPIEVAKTFRVLGGYTDKNKDRWLKLQDTFARAWVLGVWRVEETGEIVKLEVKE